MAEPTGKERRKHLRVELNLLVQYRFDTFDEFLSEYAGDISAGGIFIETDRPRPVGTMIYLQFALRDGTQLIEGLGRVVRVVPPGNPQPGMGVEFENLDTQSQDLILEHITRTTGDLDPSA